MQYILGIDPGTHQTAVVTYCIATERPLSQVSGIFQNNHVIPLIEQWIYSYRERPMVVIEKFESFGMAIGKETIDTIFFSGRIFERVERTGARVHLVTRKEVKIHHCGHARANDSNIRAALIDRLGGQDSLYKGRAGRPATKNKPAMAEVLPGKLAHIKGDMWSALALALFQRDNLAA